VPARPPRTQRPEAEGNDLAVRNDHFLALGLTPTTLSEGLLTEVRDVAARYAHRADPRKIISRSVWRAGMPCANDLLPVRLPLRGRAGRRASPFTAGAV
jgi:UDP-sulfoquinovose synthase